MRFLSKPVLLLLAAVAAIGPCPPRLFAYPPAPHHVIEGVVRDSLGNPLKAGSARIILEAASGTQVTSFVNAGLDEGLNYELTIPMDAGLTSDLYRPTALQPFVPFKIKVRIGTVTYLPIEMKGDYTNLGMPGQRTRLDLTLGEDTDGDGLPDPWERALIQMLGGNRTLADIRPEDDADGDGLSNLKEYVAGTYAYDPKAGIALDIVRTDGGVATLEFMAIRGRTYTILGTEEMASWAPTPFTVNGSGTEAVSEYRASDVRLMRVHVPVVGAQASGNHFFKLRVQ